VTLVSSMIEAKRFSPTRWRHHGSRTYRDHIPTTPFLHGKINRTYASTPLKPMGRRGLRKPATAQMKRRFKCSWRAGGLKTGHYFLQPFGRGYDCAGARGRVSNCMDSNTMKIGLPAALPHTSRRHHVAPMARRDKYNIPRPDRPN